MSRVTYNVPQPVQPVDGSPVYTKVEIWRAPDAAGVSGIYTKIATVTGSTTGKFFVRYEDDAASSTLDDWYKHRYTDTAGTGLSDFSDEVQVDEFLAILWALGDIADADININDVTQWANQAVVDLWTHDIWQRYPSGATERTAALITPTTDAVSGTVDEYYDIPSDLFEVARIEKLSATTNRHKAWCFKGVEWDQEDRQVRLVDADRSTVSLYRVHGKRRYRDINELGEELFQLIYWQIRKQYLDFRVNQRANAPRFLVFDRKSDTTPEQLAGFLKIAEQQVQQRVQALQPEPFPIDYAPGIAV